jgi:hypothetical protein
VRARLITAIACVVLGLAGTGCGGDDSRDFSEATGVPAAGENTPPTGTPGVPKGVAYDVDGRGWERLARPERLAAAKEFIADNPSRCEGADVGAVAFYVTNSYGIDFPLDIPAADILLEGCDADAQS